MTLITNLDAASSGGIHSASSIASFLRPANATVYTANDVITDSVSVAAAIEFPNTGKSGKIMRARLAYEQVTTAAFSLMIFDAEPTNLLDNVALALVTGDVPKLIARFDFADASKLALAAGIAAYRAALDYDALGGVPYNSPDGKLYGVLVTTNGFTPASGTKVHLRLQLEFDHR